MPDSTKIAFRTSLVETTPFDAEGLGTLRFEGANIYKWVKYVGANTTTSSGGVDYVEPWIFRVAYYSGATGYQNSEVTIDLTAVANTRIPAGVLISSSTDTVDGRASYSYPTGYKSIEEAYVSVYQNRYCWIQIKGTAVLRSAGAGYTYGLTQSDGSVTVAAGLPSTNGSLQDPGPTDCVSMYQGNDTAPGTPRGFCDFVF